MASSDGDDLSALYRVNYRDFKSLPGSVWQCACGFTGANQDVTGHRKGFKNRPECQGKNAQGKSMWCIDLGDSPLAQQIRAADAGTQPTPGPAPAPTPEPPAASAEEEPGLASESERIARAPEHEDATPEGEADSDPEAVARALLGSARDGSLGRLESLSDLLARHQDEGPPELPPGDWSLEDPPQAVTSTRTTVTVHMRAELLLAFDWCVAHGWHAEARPNLDDWVDEMLLDHWTSCMGKVIAVGDRVEFDGSNAGQDDSRLEAGVPA